MCGYAGGVVSYFGAIVQGHRGGGHGGDGVAAGGGGGAGAGSAGGREVMIIVKKDKKVWLGLLRIPDNPDVDVQLASDDFFGCETHSVPADAAALEAANMFGVIIPTYPVLG